MRCDSSDFGDLPPTKMPLLSPGDDAKGKTCEVYYSVKIHSM